MEKKTKIAAATASAISIIVLVASTVIAANSGGINVHSTEMPVIVGVAALVWWIVFELMRLKR